MKLFTGDERDILRAYLLFYVLLAVAFTGALLYGRHKHYHYGESLMSPADTDRGD
ncbi:MAG TPA: hypothetical protein VL172_16865 [Kofleriaceae bacterium]|jgi:hypothetical protein|nr:hypothetical protein [Kofleriaceae bacterium]